MFYLKTGALTIYFLIINNRFAFEQNQKQNIKKVFVKSCKNIL